MFPIKGRVVPSLAAIWNGEAVNIDPVRLSVRIVFSCKIPSMYMFAPAAPGDASPSQVATQWCQAPSFQPPTVVSMCMSFVVFVLII